MNPTTQKLKNITQHSKNHCPLIQHWNTPEKPPTLTPNLPEKLHPTVKQKFNQLKLYKHQHEFITHALNGEDCFIITGTGGGKTISFIIPAIHTIQTQKKKALIIYPTKALAYDQLQTFKEQLNLNADILDGDNPNKKTCLQADIIITNPQALTVYLNYGILNQKTIEKIGIIIIDEFHFLKGIEAGNFALTLRNLLFKNNDQAQILLASATVGNPEELAKTYFPHRNFTIIKGNHGKTFEKDYLIFKYTENYDRYTTPPTQTIKQLPDWIKEWYTNLKPRISEIGPQKFAIPIISEITHHNANTIVFCKRKIDCENLLRQLREYSYNKYGTPPEYYSTYYSTIIIYKNTSLLVLNNFLHQFGTDKPK